MAKTKKQTEKVFIPKPKVKNPNVHSKKKTSVLKSSKNYKKAYNGQGR